MLRLVFAWLLNLLRAPFYPIWWLARRGSRPRTPWLRLKLRSRMVESPPSAPRWVRWVPRLARRLPMSVGALRRFAGHVANDAAVEGVLVELPRLQVGWASCAAVRAVIAALRDAGKETLVYLPEGAGNRELFVASAADRVVVGAGSTCVPLGLSLSVTHLKGALDLAGLRFDVLACGEYKTAAERLVSETMSEPQREQLGALLETHRDGLEDALRGKLRDPRAFLDRGLCDAGDLVEVGFAESAGFADDVLGLVMAGSAGRPGSGGAYLRHQEARFFRSVTRPPFLAVVPLGGLIVEGDGGAGRNAIAFDPIARLLRALGKDPRCLGVLLQIDSPGGSALTSERLYREIRRLGERKPVVAWMEDVAASGGYYLAAAAGYVVATETAVTGSIGVVTAKLDASALLARFGIRTETVRLHARADMLSPVRGLDDGEREAFDRHANELYRRFVGAVAESRAMPAATVEGLARGRVWSGRDAAANGLVDALGGIDVALDALRARLDVPPALRDRVDPRVVRPRELGGADPGPPPPVDALLPEPLRELLVLRAGGARWLTWLPAVPRVG